MSALDDYLVFQDQLCKHEAIKIMLLKVWGLKNPRLCRNQNR